MCHHSNMCVVIAHHSFNMHFQTVSNIGHRTLSSFLNLFPSIWRTAFIHFCRANLLVTNSLNVFSSENVFLFHFISEGYFYCSCLSSIFYLSFYLFIYVTIYKSRLLICPQLPLLSWVYYWAMRSFLNFSFCIFRFWNFLLFLYLFYLLEQSFYFSFVPRVFITVLKYLYDSCFKVFVIQFQCLSSGICLFPCKLWFLFLYGK